MNGSRWARAWVVWGLVGGGLLLAAGCELEDRSRTHVQELRVLGARVEPSELIFPADPAAPPLAGEDLRLQVRLLVVDPTRDDSTFDVVLVACTERYGVCLEMLDYAARGAPWVDEGGDLTEAAWRDWLTQHAWRGSVTLDGVSGEVQGDLLTFAGWPAYFDVEEVSAEDARVTALVCRPGTCPAIDRLDAYLGDPRATGGEALHADLTLPQGIAGVPVTDGMLARKTYLVVEGEPGGANVNPEVGSLALDQDVVSPGETATLQAAQDVLVRVPSASFEDIYGVDGTLLGIEALTLSLYATSGEITPTVVQVSYTQGQASFRWEGVTEGPNAVWAVVRDSRAGQGWLEVRGVR